MPPPPRRRAVGPNKLIGLVAAPKWRGKRRNIPGDLPILALKCNHEVCVATPRSSVAHSLRQRTLLPQRLNPRRLFRPVPPAALPENHGGLRWQMITWDMRTA